MKGIKSAAAYASLVALPLSLCAKDKPTQQTPNVIIIYGDDVGYGDVGAYGAKLIPTPNIDKLAKESLMFTDGHAAASTCTPSRFSMLTGIQAIRRPGTGILRGNAKMPIKTTDFTLPKLFKKAGYATAAIGKWHLGLGAGRPPIDWNGEIKPGPLEIGFDYCFLVPATNDRVPCVYLKNHKILNLDPNDPITVSYRRKAIPDSVKGTSYPDGKKNPEAMTFYNGTQGHNNTVINGIGRIGYMKGGKSALWDDSKMSEEFLNQTQKFIADNKDRPFFIYFASQCIHVPRVPAERFRGTTKLGYRGDSMVEFDWVTGELLKTLDKYELTDNTIVIFSSDNGPVYNDGYDDGTKVMTSRKEVDNGHDGSGPFRGGKYQIYEGGTTVPFLIRWPRKIKPGVSNALISQVDFIASFAALLGIKLSQDQAPDSRNRLDTLLGKDKVGDPFILEQTNKHANAIRKGPWKYIQKGNRPELYNLTDDIGERHNIIKKHPEKAKELDELLTTALKSKGIRKE